jgi:hypothetical protein
VLYGINTGFAEKSLLSFLAKNPGIKCMVTPALPNTINFPTDNACNSEHLRPDATAIKNSVLRVISRNEADSIGSKGNSLSFANTVGKSHLGQNPADAGPCNMHAFY